MDGVNLSEHDISSGDVNDIEIIREWSFMIFSYVSYLPLVLLRVVSSIEYSLVGNAYVGICLLRVLIAMGSP